MVRAVYQGTPAYDQGLNTGDQIVALDGIRVNRESLNERLGERKPGDIATFTIFRFDELRTFKIKLGGKIDQNYRIVRVDNPTDAQRHVHDNWLSAPYDQAPKG